VLSALEMFKSKPLQKAEEKLLSTSVNKNDRIFNLLTPVSPVQSNHSYNGVLFDVKNQSKLSRVKLLGVTVGGELGDMTVWSCGSDWSPRRIVAEEWTLIAKGNFPSSTKKPTEISFSEGVELAAGARVGMYIHSARLDDRGLYYQSFRKPNEVICEDENIVLVAGLGHTSPVPFDSTEGWFRGPRGLAGSIRYLEIPAVWSVERNRDFPAEYRQAVRTLLVCHAVGNQRGRKSKLPVIPTELLFHILEFADYRWFNTKPITPPKPKASEETSPSATRSPRLSYNRLVWAREQDSEPDSD